MCHHIIILSLEFRKVCVNCMEAAKIISVNMQNMKETQIISLQLLHCLLVQIHLC